MTRVGGERSETDAAISATEDEMLTRSTREDLLRRYYRALLREEQGNLRRVAARAGRRLRDLQVELARLGVQVEAEVLARSASTS
jgi:DNA-binding NtrC family response regulator